MFDNAAIALQIQMVALECATPAASDEFVNGELERFQKITGIHCKQLDLKLQDVWPTR